MCDMSGACALMHDKDQRLSSNIYLHTQENHSRGVGLEVRVVVGVRVVEGGGGRLSS